MLSLPLARSLGLGFVRAAMHSLDRANGSEGVGPLDGEELEAKYLAYILQVTSGFSMMLHVCINTQRRSTAYNSP